MSAWWGAGAHLILFSECHYKSLGSFPPNQTYRDVEDTSSTLRFDARADKRHTSRLLPTLCHW